MKTGKLLNLERGHFEVFDVKELTDELKEQGYYEIVEFIPMPEAKKYHYYEQYFELKDGKLHGRWREHYSKELIDDDINSLKSQLAATDYKVLKCYEANLLGMEQPYDIERVHSERQSIRDRINSLQSWEQ
ncbi:MAG: hypothetical protein NC115_06420 [Bacteroidales bacterium]|nr:hypothetical protein [Bacteroidales bacterium]